MNKIKIKYYIDIYAEILEIDDKMKNLLFNLMQRIISKYEKIMPYITVDDDNLDTYLIKPKDGKYSTEDFFLNRLMRNVLNIEISNSGISNDFTDEVDIHMKGAFKPGDSEIYFNIANISKQFDKFKSIFDDENEYHTMRNKAFRKVIMHEFEHGFQSRYKGIQPYVINTYKKLAARLSKDNRYNDHLSVDELDNVYYKYNFLEYISSGVRCHDSSLDGYKTYREFSDYILSLDESLNESESLEMAKQDNYIIKTFVESGNKFICRNPESYSKYISNFGDLLKLTFGYKNSFKMMYLCPSKQFNLFNHLFKDIFEEEFSDDKDPILHVMELMNSVSKENEQDFLKLNKVLAKCFEKRIKHLISVDKVNIDAVKEQIDRFQFLSISNNDLDKNNSLEHNIILKNIRELIEKKYNANIDEETHENEKNNDYDYVNVQSIIDTINPALLKKSVKLPNGITISAKQYIQELVFPLLPENGFVILKNGNILKTKQFIEEAILFDCQDKYNGDVVKYMYENTRSNLGYIDIVDDGTTKTIQTNDLIEHINPTILSRRVKTPEGHEISVRQYIEDFYLPHIPANGMIILKNNIEIPAIQYIEENLINNIEKYNGDISKILYNTTNNNSGSITYDYNKISNNVKKLKNQVTQYNDEKKNLK